MGSRAGAAVWQGVSSRVRWAVGQGKAVGQGGAVGQGVTVGWEGQ